jgi:hypothetical protein
VSARPHSITWQTGVSGGRAYCEEQTGINELHAFTLQAAPRAEFARAILYGRVNRMAQSLLDKRRLAILPSSGENLPRSVFQNFGWWARNGQKTGDRSNGRILS